MSENLTIVMKFSVALRCLKIRCQVLHNVNTGICVLECCAAQRKKYIDKCEQSKTVITHFRHKTKLKLTLLTMCESTTSFHLEIQAANHCFPTVRT